MLAKQIYANFYLLLINHLFSNNLNPLQMSKLISVTSFSKLAYQETTVTTAAQLVINVDNIISVSARVSTAFPSGITTVLYALPYNQMTYQIPLIVTETVAAVLASANANAVAT